MGFLVTPSAPAGTDVQWTFLQTLDLATESESADYSAYDELLVIGEDILGDASGIVYLSTNGGGSTFRYSFIDGASNGEDTARTGIGITANATKTRSGRWHINNTPYMSVRSLDNGSDASANQYVVQGYNTAVAFTTIKFIGGHGGKANIYGRNFK